MGHFLWIRRPYLENKGEKRMNELQDLITGLEGKIKGLQTDKEVFIRAQGMDIEAEKLRAEAQKINDAVADLKVQVGELQSGKIKAIAPVVSGMSAAMNAFLATGSATLQILEDGDFFIGWVNEAGQTVPYAGLSGGEKVSFDAALAKALGATVLCVEVAELDEAHLQTLLEKYAASDIEQIICSTCHGAVVVAAKWEVTNLGLG